MVVIITKTHHANATGIKNVTTMNNIAEIEESDSLSNPKRERHAGQRHIMGMKTCIGNGAALSVMLTCVNVTRRCLLEFAFGRLGGTAAHAS